MKIMIVDNSAAVRALIRIVLDDVADEFVECVDGDEACARYAESRPDWVLMDVESGRLGGLEATRRLVSAFPGARVVVVTQYDDVHYRAAAAAAGASRYVVKANLLGVRRLIEGGWMVIF